MFAAARTTPLFVTRDRVEALETWRAAAIRVATRWQMFIEAEPESRVWTFASYVAALDAEEASASDLAVLSSRLAA
jgi:hypothetical protein